MHTINKYRQTCIKRSHLGQRKNDLIRQVTSLKGFNSYEMFYDGTRKKWPFNTGDCWIKAGLTVDKLPPKKCPPPPALALAFEFEELEALPPSPVKLYVLHIITLVHIELKYKILLGIMLG